MLIGEGVYGLTVVGATTSPVYWILQTVIGVALLVSTVVAARPRIAPGVLGSVLTVGGAAALLGFYAWLGQLGSTV